MSLAEGQSQPNLKLRVAIMYVLMRLAVEFLNVLMVFV